VNKGFYLPRNVSKNLVDDIKHSIESNALNVGLFLDRFILWWYDEKEKKWNSDVTVQTTFLRKILGERNSVKSSLNNRNLKGNTFRDRILRNEKLSIPYRCFPINLYENYSKRTEKMLLDLKHLNYHVKRIGPLPLEWRLVINLGAASTYETSILLHRNYSIPFIPGSAVKGVTYHYALELRDNNKILEKDINKIFGTQKTKGEVIFFDAFPVFEQTDDFVVADVMNVHYRDYYQDESGRTPPRDSMNPVPVFFLAVEGLKYRFTVASKDQQLAEKAGNLVSSALREFGIGAKTSTGYGYFKLS